MSSKTLVTVCIPVFNARTTIERCLKAVLQQDLNAVHILLVDNFSDDGTFELAEKLLKDCKNSRLVRNESNLGRIENWNRCLDLSETRFVKFALANDVLLPGSLQCLLQGANAAADTAMVCSWYRESTELPETLPQVPANPTICVRSPLETARFFAGHGFRTGGLNGMMFNREYIQSRGLRFRADIPYCADYLFGIELSESGSSVFIDAETYLFHSGNSSRFHYVGMKDPVTYFSEQTQCARLLTRRLDNDPTAFETLLGQFRWLLSKGLQIRLAEVWKAFAAAPGWLRFKTLWLAWKVRSRLAMKRVELRL